MTHSFIDGNALLNAAAVWFILRAIEVLAFVVYDCYSAISTWLRDRSNPDPDPRKDTFKRERGWIEYVLSGTGFLSLSLCRQRKILLLLTSTMIPVASFVLELLSITLGNERRTCITSTDPNVVSSPSLVLFGEGSRHANLSTTLAQTGFGTVRSEARPCISWSSTHAGVDFLSSICVDATNLATQAFMSTRLGLPSRTIGLLLSKHSSDDGAVMHVLFATKLQSTTSLSGQILLGTLQFVSEVVVNGKNVLYQNTSITSHITEEQKNQLVTDFRFFEKAVNLPPKPYIEDENWFGFAWEDASSYALGADMLIYAVLAQATREPVKTAAKMSYLNTIGSFGGGFDISCEEDFRLPRTVSIVIIVVAVVFRFILIFMRKPQSSVEYALEKSEEELLRERQLTDTGWNMSVGPKFLTP